MNIVSESFIKQIQHKYTEKNKEDPKDNNVKTVAFYDRKKMIPSEYDGVDDVPFVFEKDTIINGKPYKKGDNLYELYIRITNSKDKFSIYDQKAKEILVKNKGMVHQKDFYKSAYEKYLNLKQNNCKTKEELEKDRLLRNSLDKDKQMEELRQKLANAQAEKSKLQETVSAFSNTNPKVKKDDATDNISKHSKNNKK
jgi:hypothetical protein